MRRPMLPCSDAALRRHHAGSGRGGAADEVDSFNVMGYAILGLALIGWMFFLVCSEAPFCTSSRRPGIHMLKNPVMCEAPSELNRLLCFCSVHRTPRAGVPSTIPYPRHLP